MRILGDQIRQCPFCDFRIKETVYMSFNTSNATHWTDGKIEGFYIPRVVKCENCNKYYWMVDAKILGYASFDSQVEYAKKLNHTEFLEAIEKGLCESKAEELYLRKQLWWAINDFARYGTIQEDFKAQEKTFKDNLEKLLVLLDFRNPENKYLKGEILRELGHFEESRTTLLSLPKSFKTMVDQVLVFVDEKDTIARKFKPEEPKVSSEALPRIKDFWKEIYKEIKLESSKEKNK